MSAVEPEPLAWWVEQEVLAALGDHNAYVRQVLALFEASPGRLEWHVDDNGLIEFTINCSDVFYWSALGAEVIVPADLPTLREAVMDAHMAGRPEMGVYLFAARKRGMRPHGGFYDEHMLLPDVEITALFDAVGPVRRVDVSNPMPHPVDR